MKTTIFILALLLIAISQVANAAAYKVQIYNGTGQTITMHPGLMPIDKPWGEWTGQCKWANTNFDMSDRKNWSTSTSGNWMESVTTPRTMAPSKHRTLWCVDNKPKRWERRFQVYVGCNPPDGARHMQMSYTFEKNHLRVYEKYVFSLDGSHCIPN